MSDALNFGNVNRCLFCQISGFSFERIAFSAPVSFTEKASERLPRTGILLLLIT